MLLLLLVLRRESLSSSSCLCVRLSISLHQVLRRSLLSLEVTVCPTHIDIALLLPITQTPLCVGLDTLSLFASSSLELLSVDVGHI